MFDFLKPYAGPAAILAIEVGAGMTGWASGFLLGLAGFWFLMALFSHKALLKRFPWLPEWAPFLDPTHAFATADQLTGRFISQRSFRITEIAHDSFISNRTFDDCDIYGPAVIAPLGIGTFLDCHFDAPPEILVIRVQQERAVGVIKVERCNFTNCRFHNIAFIGPENLLNVVRGALQRPAEEGNENQGPQQA